jgi:imidazolonepropionase-like amidohydrolase
MTATLFNNATIVDGQSEEAREGLNVLVDNGRIAEVSDKAIKAPEGARVIDLKGRGTLMPGLIDNHVHVKATMLNLAGLNDVPVSYLIASAAQIMKAMLMRGFTTVRDAAGADRGMADAVEHGLVVGPRMFVSGLALSQTGGHGDFRSPTAISTIITCACQVSAQQMGRIADGADECRRAARDELRKGAHHLKIMAGGGVASPTDPIQNTQYSYDEIRAIVEECEASHTYATAHAYTPHAIKRVVECGVACVEHGNLVDAESAKLMAERGVYHVPTNITYFAMNKHGKDFGLPEVSLEKLKEIVDAGLRAVEITRDAGVKIGHGSDLLGPLHKYQSDEFSLKAEVLGNHGAIKAATMTNAEIIRQQDQLGQVKEGFLADLIVVDGDPLKDIGVLENDGAKVRFVMKAGEVFKDQLEAA